MSLFQTMVASIERGFESAEKSSIIANVDQEIKGILASEVPQTEAEAVALVNQKVPTIINNVKAKISNPLLRGLISVDEKPIENYIEGAIDGLDPPA